MSYPTEWKRSTMRGCGPHCQARHVPVETRMTGPDSMEVRHVPTEEMPPEHHRSYHQETK